MKPPSWWSKEVKTVLPSVFDLSEYQYRPLPSPSSIRVLELLTGSEGREHQLGSCKIHVLDLAASHAEYSAVSYACGNTLGYSTPIECDGQRIFIQPNLYSALLRVRHVKKSRFVWADAICIDQGTSAESLAERASQVAMMGKVYSRASEVLVDLGEGDDDKDIVKTLKQYTQCDNDLWQAAVNISRPRYYRVDWDTYAGDRKTVFRAFNLPKEGSKVWLILCHFVVRPWFRRLWVLQEFALAQSIHVMIGSYTVDEATLTTGLERASEHFNYISSMHIGMGPETSLLQTLSTMYNPWSARRRGFGEGQIRVHLQYLPQGPLRIMKNTRACVQREHAAFESESYDMLKLHRLIFETRFLLVSDARDRLYGILGLVSNFVDEIPYVDYTESLTEMSLRLTQNLVRYGSPASVLNHAVCLTCNDKPSWTVTLDDVRPELMTWGSLVTVDGDCRDGLFDAGGQNKVQLRFISDTNVICAQGRLIGTLMSQSGVTLTWMNHADPRVPLREMLQAFTHFTDQMKRLLIWIEDARDLRRLSRGTSDVGNEPFELASWRTMMSDILPTNDGVLHRLETSPDKDKVLRQLSEYAATKPNFDALQFMPFTSFVLKTSFLFTRHIALAETGPCNVPREAEVGDQIAVLSGFPLPLLLRPSENGTFRIVGSCYVHGMMDGQALGGSRWPLQEIMLS